MNELIVIFVTASSMEEAGNIGHTLVEQRLVACANIVPGIRSIYHWKGEIQNDTECLLIMKAPGPNFKAIREKVRSLHSYECPEIIAVAVKDVDPEYRSWVLNSTAGS